jgi:hypothetical protein
MTDENFAISLEAFHSRRPFQPFEIELVIGERIQIDHPEALAHRGGEVAVFVRRDGRLVFLDHESVCSVQDLSAKRQAGAN